MNITDPSIERYIRGLAPEADEHLRAMEERAAEEGFPIVDRLVGRLLYLFAKLRRPRLVVELGSGFGYSAYWFALAMEGGKVVLTDRDEDNISSARDTFERAGLSGKAEFRTGEAVETAKGYDGMDILFIDIDKEHYREAAAALIPALSEHALVIADNALWYGRVTQKDPDAQTRGIMEFNEYMFGLEGFFTTILPVRDGVLVSYKL